MQPCKSISPSIILQKGRFATKPGTIYITATPIGNLGDITIRAIETLQSVDFIICEDTRKTAILLKHYGIKSKLFIYNDHSDSAQRDKFISQLQAGKSAALVSDAGMPLIADPGYKLIADAVAAGVEVSVIPGPSATLSAIALSALPSDRFIFYGFMPEKEAARQKAVEEITPLPYTTVFFESPKRLSSLLEFMASVMPQRKMAIAREITKLHEEVYRGDVAGALAWASAHTHLKGEIVVVLDAGITDKQTPEQLESLALQMLESHSIKDTAQELSKSFSIPKKQLYELCLKLKNSITT